jgi:hypothetical protein
VLRRNYDIFVIFKFANAQSVVEPIYPEISGVIKKEDFKDVFEHATIDKHDALIIDQTAKHIFKLNRDTALILNLITGHNRHYQISSSLFHKSGFQLVYR